MKKKVSDYIYEKNFSIEQFGYSVVEVDSFYDEILVQVRFLEKEIDKLNRDKEFLQTQTKNLKDTNTKLEIENTRLKSSKGNEIINTDNYNNIEVIERLSKLENAVSSLKKMIENKS